MFGEGCESLLNPDDNFYLWITIYEILFQSFKPKIIRGECPLPPSNDIDCLEFQLDLLTTEKGMIKGLLTAPRILFVT